MNTKIFYTDGSCSKNPGPGAYGVTGWKLVEDTLCIIYYKREQASLTTNNRMELSAILHVMKLAAEDASDSKYIIYSDSAYCVNMIKPGGWIETWAKNGWKNSKKQDVENIDLVKEVYKYRNKIFSKMQVEKVKGHSNSIQNEITDAIATGNVKKISSLVSKNNIKII